jgi:hypothetical protein
MNLSGSKTLSDLPPIYYRAFNSYPHILDVTDFFDSAASAQTFIQQLLKNQAFEQSIPLSASLLSEIKSIFFEAQNQKRLHGDAILGIGYPLLALKHSRQIILAPLLIWPIQLEPHVKDPGIWHLKYLPTHQIQINPYWLHHWQTYFGWNHQDIVQKHKTYPSLLQKTINELIEKIIKEVHPPQKGKEFFHAQEAFSVNPLPELSALDDSASELSVYWSAVFGGFPPIFPQLPIQITALKKEPLQWKDSSFGINVIPPDLASAWHSIRQYKNSRIKGSLEEALPLLAHLFSNILSNGRTALIISSQQSSLQSVLQLLSGYQMEDFAFLFQNKREDWPLLRQLMLKNAQPGKLKSYDNNAFENLQSQLQKMEARLLQAYQASHQSVFEDLNFRETLGCFFHHQKQQGKELLNSQLEASDYQFDQATFEEISRAIRQSFPLYQQINTLNHPLGILHPSVLESEQAELALQQLSKRLETVKRHFIKLQHQYISVSNQYAEALHKYYQEVFQQLNGKLQKLTDKLTTYNKKYGVDFQLTSLASLQLISRFSGKYKKILAAKKEVIDEFQQLYAYYEDHAYFGFQFHTLSERRNIAKWNPELEAFREALAEWQKVLPAQIKKELLRLSPSRTKENLQMHSEMLQLEQSLEKKIEELNAAQIFQETFKNVMLTLQKQQSYLESIVEKVEHTQVFLKDFPAYFQWKKCWTALTPGTRKVVKALTKVKPEDWLTAFKSWFLYHRLSQAFDETLPDLKLSVADYARQYLHYTQQLPLQIQALWANRRDRSRKEWKSSDKIGYQSFFSNIPEPSDHYFGTVDQILQHFREVTQHMPLFLTSPTGALQLGKAPKLKFDYAILLDGALQSLQEAQPSFELSEKIVVLEAPNHQKLKQQQQPLSDHLNELPTYTLASQKEGEKVFEDFSGENIQLITCEGSFNEQEEVNILEVQELFHLLNKIEQTPQRIYPKVQIVCMTKAQRDLVYGHLLDIKQRNLPGKDKIQQLERNGLAVYHLDEIPLPTAECLIISNTYGPTDQQGMITDRLQRWTQSRFERQISELFKQNHRQVYILHSIPPHETEPFQRSQATYPRFLFKLHFPEKEPVFPEKGKIREENDRNLSAKLYFIQEVGEQLKPYLEAHRLELKIDRLLSQEILFIMRPDNSPLKVGILPDGFLGQSPSTHFTWEFQQIERYREQGIHLIPSYSVSWWTDAEQEIQRLLQLILDLLH